MASTTTTSASKSNGNGNANTADTSASITANTIWQWEIDRVDKWIRTIHTLYPPQNTAATANNNTKPPAATTTTTGNNPAASSPATTTTKTTTTTTPSTDYWKKISQSNIYLQNLITALQSASTQQTTASDRDLYKILDSSFSRGKEVIHKPGAILSRITYGGILNGICGVIGGVCEPSIRPDLGKVDKSVVTEEAKVWARLLRQAAFAKLEMDMMESTMPRVVEILCPEVSLAEVNAIRKRIYDTVVLGRGTGSSSVANALDNDDLPVAARVGMHDIDKWKKCKVCNNNDQSSFCLDRKNGDLICTICGTIASQSLMHEGSQFRKFEGEADRNHHGDVANPLYSNAHNMSTTLGGVGFQSNQGMGGTSKRTMETVLRNAHAYTEMNISQFGKDEKKTREGYKDRQKKDAFVKMTHVGDALNLHEAVVQRAKELFAGFRDDRELVQQFKGVVAACLCEAYHQLSSDGRQILRKVAGEEAADDAGVVGARANWRNDMHKSTAASTPGFFDGGDDDDADDKNKTTSSSNNGGNGDNNGKDDDNNNSSSPENKHAPLWTLDDCRSWLLESSRAIARLWHETPSHPNAKKPLSELEGKLVEHTLVLCDYLERQLKSNNNSNGGGSNGNKRRRVVTPRCNDMAHLKITWQHFDTQQKPQGAKSTNAHHQQGTTTTNSNGKRTGGAAATSQNGATTSGKTAGQYLILLTVRKWSAVINDPMAGEAFHKELRALLAKQDSKKKKLKSEEGGRRRIKQMKRKPWLAARVKKS